MKGEKNGTAFKNIENVTGVYSGKHFAGFISLFNDKTKKILFGNDCTASPVIRMVGLLLRLKLERE